jgi:hypothetical protein
LSFVSEQNTKTKGHVMPDENSNDPVGEPQPIDPRKGRAIWKRFATMAGVTIGGVVAFAALVMPTRTQGASRSARLNWQRKEAPEATAAVAAGTNAAATDPQGQATGADNR